MLFGARIKDVYVYNFPFYLKLQLNVQYGTCGKKVPFDRFNDLFFNEINRWMQLMVLRLGTVLFLATLISSLKKRIKIERTVEIA